jgi:nitrogen PTS system EIIA component
LKITSILNLNCIHANLNAETKEDSIKILVHKLYSAHSEFKKAGYKEADILDFVLKREKEQSTGLGKNLAFPHSRIQKLDGLFIAIGICKKGLDYNSIDKQPVNIICLLISEEKEASLLLQGMATLVRFFNEDDNKNKVLAAKTEKEIWNVINKTNLDLSNLIYASDIMRPCKAVMSWDKTIYQTARVMHLNHLDVIPVVDENDNFKGDISCVELFSFGIPDFFFQLNTVSFVRNIDPFEKYFKSDKDVKIKDIYRKKCGVVRSDATLVEIVFEMTTNKYSQVFVVEDEKLLGVIDSFNIVDRVLCI